MVIAVGVVALSTVLLAQEEPPLNVGFYMIGKLITSLETSFRIQLMLSQIILSKMATFQR